MSNSEMLVRWRGMLGIGVAYWITCFILVLMVVATSALAEVSSADIYYTNWANPYQANYNQILSSNAAANAINKVLDTGTVCRVTIVGPSAVNVTSLNGSTNNIGHDVANAIEGKSLTSYGEVLNLVAASVTNGMGNANDGIDSDNLGTISGTGQAGSLTASLYGEALDTVMAVDSDVGSIVDADLSVVGSGGGTTVLAAWCYGMVTSCCPRVTSSQATAAANVMTKVISVTRPAMPFIWVGAEQFAIWMNGWYMFQWLLFRKPSEAAAPGTQLFGISFPAIQSVAFTVGLAVLAAATLGTTASVAIGIGSGSGTSAMGQCWEIMQNSSGYTSMSTDFPGSTGVLSTSAVSMSLSQFFLMFVDAILDFNAMWSAVRGTMTGIVASWIVIVILLRLMGAATTVAS